MDGSGQPVPACPPRGCYRLLTSPGPAAIAVIRVTGPAAGEFARQCLRSRRAGDPASWPAGAVLRCELRDLPANAEESGEWLDQIVVSVHRPAADWDLRLHLHGSPALVRRCFALLAELGLTQLSGGEDALWPGSRLLADVHGALPQMQTPLGVRWLLDQSRWLPAELLRLSGLASEDRRAACQALLARGRVFDWLTRPARIVLVGPPNAGKSTLANALADRAVSLVSPQPGTTRDWVDVPGQIRGFPVLWIDTAGLRSASDTIESAAVRRTEALIRSGSGIVIVLDGTPEGELANRDFISTYGAISPLAVALSKSDIRGFPGAVLETLPSTWRERTVAISAVTADGLPELQTQILRELGYDPLWLAGPAAFTPRLVRLLEFASQETDNYRCRAALLDYAGLRGPGCG